MGFVDEEFVYNLWNDIFDDIEWSSRIQAIADQAEDIGLVKISWHEVLHKVGKLAEIILENPEIAFRVGEASLNAHLAPDHRIPIEISVTDLPMSSGRMIEEVGVKDLGKLRFSDVIIYRRKQNKARPIIGVFKCTSCGFKQEVLQDKFHFTEPLECPKDDGGCGKRAGSTTFKFIVSETVWIDTQTLYCQDPYERTSKAKPDRAQIILDGSNQVNKIKLGDRVRIIYEVVAKQETKDGQEFSFLLKCRGYEPLNDLHKVELTSDDESWIQSNASELMHMGVRSIAPWIFGYDVIKLALWLQFIGVPAGDKDGDQKYRSDFHILLFGDGGTGKSQLIEDMVKIWPKSHFAGGKSSTSAGLTVAVVPDEFGKGMTLEAGVMVLADKGLAGIDELDKASREDISSMHMAMENQVIPVNKAGFNLQIPTRPTVLSGANPRTERFIPEMSILEQSHFEDTLLQRFALKFKIWDHSDREVDLKRAKHSILSKSKENPVGKRVITVDQMRKIRQYCQRIDPIIDDEIIDFLALQYVDLRSRMEIGSDRSIDRITQRTLEDLERLCKAVARSRLHEIVVKEDVSLAVWLYERSLRVIENGVNCSIDIEMSGYSIRPQLISLKDTIALISKLDKGNGVNVDVVRTKVNEMKMYGLDDQLEVLFEKGAIFYPRSNKVSVNGGVI